MTEQWDIREAHLLLDINDENAFRRWAIENKYGDSAYAFRRLLEKAGVEPIKKTSE
jgi:hypothetical protein